MWDQGRWQTGGCRECGSLSPCKTTCLLPGWPPLPRVTSVCRFWSLAPICGNGVPVTSQKSKPKTKDELLPGKPAHAVPTSSALTEGAGHLGVSREPGAGSFSLNFRAARALCLGGAWLGCLPKNRCVRGPFFVIFVSPKVLGDILRRRWLS